MSQAGEGRRKRGLGSHQVALPGEAGLVNGERVGS